MNIKNERVKWKKHEEVRKQEYERKKLFDWKHLFMQTIDVICQKLNWTKDSINIKNWLLYYLN